MLNGGFLVFYPKLFCLNGGIFFAHQGSPSKRLPSPWGLLSTFRSHRLCHELRIALFLLLCPTECGGSGPDLSLNNWETHLGALVFAKGVGSLLFLSVPQVVSVFHSLPEFMSFELFGKTSGKHKAWTFFGPSNSQVGSASWKGRPQSRNPAPS